MSVYILKHPHGFYKIGQSKSPRKRQTNLKRGSPYEVTLHCVLNTYNSGTYEETKLHKHFSDNHVHGEWFEIPEEVLMDKLHCMVEESDDVLSVIMYDDIAYRRVVPNSVK